MWTTVPSGSHQLELVLAEGDRTKSAAVAIVGARDVAGAGEPMGGGFLIPPRRASRAFVATAKQPVEVTLSGPATLRVGIRPVVGRTSPSYADIGAYAVSGIDERRISLARDRDPDVETDVARVIVVGREQLANIVLPAEELYRVVIAPDRGKLLVELRLRQDRPHEDGPALASLAWQRGELESPVLLRWPLLPLPLQVLNAPALRAATPSALGTLSLALRAGRDDLLAVEGDEGARGVRLQFGVDWQRSLAPRRWWVRLGVNGRSSAGADELSYGMRASAQGRQLPLGMRVDTDARAQVQRIDGSAEWAVRADARLGRSIRASQTLTLRSEVGLRWRALSLSTSAGDVAAVDPWVYSRYARTHRRALNARAMVRWRPWRAQLGSAAAAVASNEDLGSLDHAAVQLHWRGRLRWPGLGAPLHEVAYAPSYRFADGDRPDGYVRHDLRVRLRWPLWTPDRDRLSLELRAHAYVASAIENLAVLGLWLRYDLTHGRGARDFLPTESASIRESERRPWIDAP